MDVIDDTHESGERGPSPTAGLRRLTDFVNTNDLEGGEDDIGTPELLGRWLAERGALPVTGEISSDQHVRALDLREGLRALGRANNGEALDPALVARLNAAAATLPLVAGVEWPERWSLAASGEAGLDAYLANLVATVVASMADGTWSRVKACRNDTCRWLFYDHSRNRSGTWCTMAVCGSRMKARAYRARRRVSERRAGSPSG